MTDSPDDPDKVGSAQPASLDCDFEPEIVWVAWDQFGKEFITPEADPMQLDVRRPGHDGRGMSYDPNAVLLPLHRYNELVEKAARSEESPDSATHPSSASPEAPRPRPVSER